MDSPWHVAHTRPRAEKRVAEYFRREGWPTELPLYASIKRYRGKRLTFYKTLFPGYVFVRLNSEQIPLARQHQHVASLLVPPDPGEFSAQLDAILTGLNGQLEVRIAPDVTEGRRVRLVAGPFAEWKGSSSSGPNPWRSCCASTSLDRRRRSEWPLTRLN